DLDMAFLDQHLGPDIAGIMLTNPSTLGVFERRITEIAARVHEAGGLLYYDGANLNAILGRVQPGQMGFDAMHLNLHKTFATPHGGGGPGAGA
ncbi:aminomethyl-transferring glycine dehydrogenase subunit GcvPB, partial [Acidithiobacillus ferrooxidans]|nr:aminomethyl-transferring glycine dehydrogenase subunit GcvPB [Acidithiobacillus ferrooxidans]